MNFDEFDLKSATPIIKFIGEKILGKTVTVKVYNGDAFSMFIISIKRICSRETREFNDDRKVNEIAITSTYGDSIAFRTAEVNCIDHVIHIMCKSERVIDIEY